MSTEISNLTPDLSERGFAIGLYLEHLEEASFLYEQRLSLLDDPELTWVDLDDFEERFEAHVDALVVGEDLAVAVCRQQALEGDYGELHAAVRVFCRHEKRELLDEVLRSLDEQDAERIAAVSDALCTELPAKWALDLASRLSSGGPAFARALVRPLGYSRASPSAAPLMEALPRLAAAAVPDALWSLGRLRAAEARATIYEAYLQHEDEEILTAAALALLRLADPRTVSRSADLARRHGCAFLPIGLGGGRSDLRVLMEGAASDDVAPECILALGLHGDTAAVEPLLYHLGDGAAAEPASIALQLITGAELFEEVLIPDQVDEDELFEDELQERNDREEPGGTVQLEGTTITRISRNPDAWRSWWIANKDAFTNGVRYRNGRPYGPHELLINLQSEQSPPQVRRLAAEELAIRYRCTVEFESDMFVRSQMKALTAIHAWADREANRFEAGKFYAAGERQPSR